MIRIFTKIQTRIVRFQKVLNHSHLSHFVLLFMIVFSSANLFAAPTCVSFPKQAKFNLSIEPTVEVCTTDDQYQFRIVDQIKIFSRQEFESRINRAVLTWLEEHHVKHFLQGSSRVMIWLSVPEANPQAAQPRVLIDTPKGYLSFWFDMNADEWILADHETAVLGQGKYPDSFGHRPQTIMAKAQPNANFADVTMALHGSGAYEVIDSGGGWYAAKTKLFDETAVANKALKYFSEHLKSVYVNSVVEWIAERQMVISYTIQAQ